MCIRSVKLVLQTEMQKSHFCVRPWLLPTVLNFSERKRKADRQNSILMSLLPLLLMFCKGISQKLFDGATVKNLYRKTSVMELFLIKVLG